MSRKGHTHHHHDRDFDNVLELDESRIAPSSMTDGETAPEFSIFDSHAYEELSSTVAATDKDKDREKARVKLTHGKRKFNTSPLAHLSTGAVDSEASHTSASSTKGLAESERVEVKEPAQGKGITRTEQQLPKKARSIVLRGTPRSDASFSIRISPSGALKTSAFSHSVSMPHQFSAGAFSPLTSTPSRTGERLISLSEDDDVANRITPSDINSFRLFHADALTLTSKDASQSDKDGGALTATVPRRPSIKDERAARKKEKQARKLKAREKAKKNAREEGMLEEKDKEKLSIELHALEHSFSDHVGGVSATQARPKTKGNYIFCSAHDFNAQEHKYMVPEYKSTADRILTNPETKERIRKVMSGESTVKAQYAPTLGSGVANAKELLFDFTPQAQAFATEFFNNHAELRKKDKGSCFGFIVTTDQDNQPRVIVGVSGHNQQVWAKLRKAVAIEDAKKTFGYSWELSDDPTQRIKLVGDPNIQFHDHSKELFEIHKGTFEDQKGLDPKRECVEKSLLMHWMQKGKAPKVVHGGVTCAFVPKKVAQEYKTLPLYEEKTAESQKPLSDYYRMKDLSETPGLELLALRPLCKDGCQYYKLIYLELLMEALRTKNEPHIFMRTPRAGQVGFFSSTKTPSPRTCAREEKEANASDDDALAVPQTAEFGA